MRVGLVLRQQIRHIKKPRFTPFQQRHRSHRLNGSVQAVRHRKKILSCFQRRTVDAEGRSWSNFPPTGYRESLEKTIRSFWLQAGFLKGLCNVLCRQGFTLRTGAASLQPVAGQVRHMALQIRYKGGCISCGFLLGSTTGQQKKEVIRSSHHNTGF